MLNSILLDTTAATGAGWTQYIMLGVLLLFFVGMMVFSSRSNKKRKKKVEDMISALKVGDNIKTIGGFIGTIVELSADGAFIIETGSNSMKSYLKIDKSAIYASDTANSATVEGEQAAAKVEEYDEVVGEDDVK